MQQYVITTDDCSDLSEGVASKIGVGIVNLTVNINGEVYDGVKKTIDPVEVYDLMKKGVTPSTSQVNPEQAKSFFKKYLEKGLDVIHVALSSQISGTYNSCKIAAGELIIEYPNRRIVVIDSISAALGQGLLVMQAVKEKAKGKSFNEVVDFIEARKNKICHLFTVDDLIYLQRGGRISKTEVIIGSLIGIKPILSCDSCGKLVPISKARGRKNALRAMVSKMAEIIDIGANDVVTISHGNCLEDANFIADLIKTRFNIDVVIGMLGPVIGSHSGPGTLSVFFVANGRLNRV